MQTAGQLSSEDVLRLACTTSAAVHQVDRSEGYKDLELDDLVKMRIHGVDAEYIVAFERPATTSSASKSWSRRAFTARRRPSCRTSKRQASRSSYVEELVKCGSTA